MTNEEIAVMIQQGREDLLPVLWQQVERFVRQKAAKWAVAWERAEFDDLYQSGYLALVVAVETFKPEKDTSFLTWLGNYALKTAFSEVVGCRTKKQLQDPSQGAVSLDSPIGEETEGVTLTDTLTGPDVIGAVDRKIYLEQLHEAIDRALAELPAEQAETVRLRYYGGQTLDGAARLAGVDRLTVRQREVRAFQHLRNPTCNRELRQFLDDRTDFFGLHGVHSVESVVLHRDQLTKEYRR